MATATGQIITVRRGESITLLFVVKDPAGVPINLTGYAVLFRIADGRAATTNHPRSSATNLEELTTADGELSLINVNGTKDGLQIALQGTRTLHPPFVHWCELRLTSGSTVKVVYESQFVILDSVTD